MSWMTRMLMLCSLLAIILPAVVLAQELATQSAASYIWLEKPQQTNFNINVRWPILSGKHAMGLMPDQGKQPFPEATPFVQYRFTIPRQAGPYTLWMRTFDPKGSSPARWRIDEQDWQDWQPGPPVDREVFRNNFPMSWHPIATLDLPAGEHTITLQALGNRLHGTYPYFVIDAVFLCKGDFQPAGSLSPQQRMDQATKQLQDKLVGLSQIQATSWQQQADQLVKQANASDLSAMSQLDELSKKLDTYLRVQAQLNADINFLHGTVNQVDFADGTLKVQTQWNRPWQGEAWIGLAHQGALYQAWVVSSQTTDRKQAWDVPVTRALPGMGMQVLVVPMTQPTSVFARGEWQVPHTLPINNTDKPMSWGLFKDMTHIIHPWHVNQTGTMIWDGKPYMPIGGMMNLRSTWQTRAGDPDDAGIALIGNHLAEERFKLLKQYGLDDVFFNGSFIHANPNVMQQLINLAEKYDVNYGLHIGSTPKVTARGYHAMAQHIAEVTAGNDVELSCLLEKSRKLSLDMPDTAQAIWFAIDKDNQICGQGELDMQFQAKTSKASKARDQLVGKIAFDQLPKSAAKVRFLPLIPITRDDPAGYVDHFEPYLQHLRDTYGSLTYGPHFRMWVDPLHNEMHAKPNSIPVSQTYARGFVQYLFEQYGSLEQLSKAWQGIDPVNSWEAVGRILPLHSDGKTLWAMDYQTRKIYRFTDAGSSLLHDVKRYRGNVCRDFIAQASEALKSIADVPVVLKHNVHFSDWFVNDDLAKGPDGMGYEAYCYGDSLAYHNSLVVYAEVIQSKRTQWALVTETAPAAYDGQKPYVGYRDRLQLHEDFDQMTMYGAKGIFTFGFSFDPPSRFQVTELIRDPRQLRWMAEYDKLYQSRAEALMAYQPEVYGWYPADLRHRQIIGQDSPRFAMDAMYLGVDSQIRMAPDGRWIVPALTADAPWKKLIVAKPLLPTVQQAQLPSGSNVVVLTDQTLDPLTAQGIGIIDPVPHNKPLVDFRQKVLGYQTFQTDTFNGMVEGDGSLVVWLATECSTGQLVLPDSANVTRGDGQAVDITNDAQGRSVKLSEPDRPKLTDNPPAYLRYGYRYDDDGDITTLRITGIGVDALVKLNKPAWTRWLPKDMTPQQIRYLRQAETTDKTTFNQPFLLGFSDASDNMMLGINTHDCPQVGYWFADYAFELDKPLAEATWHLRRMTRPSLDLEIFIDGNPVAKLPADSPATDEIIFSPWNAGLGVNNLKLGWQKASLGKLTAGKHVLTIRALGQGIDGQTDDQQLLGQAEYVPFDRKGMQATQLDCWLITGE